ncbi:hypothetical protein [Salinisphaera sp.]|uniref:hypothetical protein n=1 Tax=unclassified Salinisphaera TaxID=2649847 RepID=UPI000C3FD2D8|nr:hypothetical protein [Salinisphaera sp.]MBS63453.1 hypothetical protein [Salinisphaera sp.]
MKPHKRERLKARKAVADSGKRALISLATQVRDISPSEADSLDRIIRRIEAWQHRGPGGL